MTATASAWGAHTRKVVPAAWGTAPMPGCGAAGVEGRALREGRVGFVARALEEGEEAGMKKTNK
ncbi:hypothetical protein GCM10023185_34630 [Hymenobacter saemangeumensis]|uniref:Uncharacterized protein n=1 Tax=Hymenobacter saemangeumensis TaxID=1084522 RepID=A0ABP8IPI3_9BACT